MKKSILLFMASLTNCINSFKSVRAARELEPPSVANVKNSVPVLQKHLLRERAIRRIYELDLNCIIKEICVKLQKTNTDKTEVEAALHG